MWEVEWRKVDWRKSVDSSYEFDEAGNGIEEIEEIEEYEEIEEIEK